TLLISMLPCFGLKLTREAVRSSVPSPVIVGAPPLSGAAARERRNGRSGPNPTGRSTFCRVKSGRFLTRCRQIRQVVRHRSGSGGSAAGRRSDGRLGRSTERGEPARR